MLKILETLSKITLKYTLIPPRHMVAPPLITISSLKCVSNIMKSIALP